jgi:peptidoglycan hydrolase-like protein with peptidoglycan-binding domain
MLGRTVSKIAGGLLLAAFILHTPAFGVPRAAARQSAAAQTGASKTTGIGTTNSNTKRVAPKPRVIRKRKPRQRVQAAPTPARISEIQSALAAQGVYKAQPNGKWDAATIQAMKDFQASHGLTATGKLDALSLQKLGLGSEIAGRAAPLPQTPAANPSTAQQQTP